DRSHLAQQARVGPGPRGGLTLHPGVEAAGRDAEDATEPSDRVVGLLRGDEPEPAHRVVSLAKKAAAFFRISRPSRSTRTSLPSRASSSRSAVVNPFRWPASISACATQRRTAVSV